MNIDEFKNQLLKDLSIKKHMVLGTSLNNEVTTRNVSTIFMNDKIYFQTDCAMLKFLQISENPFISLCDLDIQIKGIARILGHPLEANNYEFLRLFKEKHPGSYEKYTFLENERVIEVTLTNIQRWAYENNRPIIYNFNMITKEFSITNYPMNHIMRLNEEPFEMIKNDGKDIEYRLNDEKRQLLRIGDMITFYKQPEELEFLRAVVVELNYYSDLLSMYTATFDKDFKNRYENPQAVVDDTTYYTEEDIKKYGCVAIKIKRIH